ncbi:hypothetical protein JQU17_19830 [Ponticoccus sp. SC2-23]|uniref:hypothetical protein n=1 Tax=Alexandriicola marinus TaxID=2081710 RepID=UPI000FD9E5F9|nr:hypothetical protein [Alexandriicola marinus]MBM1222464.1 hypothetical protein [Ponticoccus sp. SC6-9]MBM1226970.1 hypothetical protein [Ponticoccus sp. SC6-15]MBM1231391.1 hypothetical protein [Ponticoccus sp. SC6-38]MBM1235964.1 hypothetical protein [Ponticoccus sp. SC6-45]MBM1240414.1 hypothetical protein [Ponticoccus sp. SC6-49]MBM1244949.1 hypothetical protein [Ponticoccus sp. SC2-64]MBM1249438.1 hypothetical protein [Ponticoccus sp. SC6-42]MBM1253907.1 hypothetical protein [Pontico
MAGLSEDGPSESHPGRELFDPGPWLRAQSDHVVELAGLCADLGRLDERLHRGPAGWRQRLALAEAVGLSWWAGDRIGAEQLSLWQAARLSGPDEDALGLARAGWALRRLSSGPEPAADPGLFLERAGAGDPGTSDPIADDLAEVLEGTEGLHPVVAAARLFHLWKRRGPVGPAAMIEAAVLAMRVARPRPIGVEQGLIFLPLARRSTLALTSSGPPSNRLAAWLQQAHQAVRSALSETDRLLSWEEIVRQRVEPRPGGSLDAVIHLLRDWPLVSAPMAEAQTGSSRATVQRHLALLEAQGLTREASGQDRYRIWSAAFID